jgi:hypothetical protein
MSSDESALVERLIAYWRGEETAAAPPDQPSCRQLVAELAQSMSAVELLDLQADPEGHRDEIARRIADWLAARAPSRDVAMKHRPHPPRPTPPLSGPLGAPSAAASAPPLSRPPVEPLAAPPAPPPAQDPPLQPAPAAGARRGPAGGVEQRIKAGQGSQLLTVGEIHTQSGGVNLSLPSVWGGGPAPAREGAGASPAPPEIVRILFLGANPADSTRLRLDQEVREIENALESAELGSRCELSQRWAVRAADLQGCLLRTKPHVVHFSGHGSDGAILLESDGGASRPVAAERLARLLAQFNQRLRCVVLNACYSALQAEALAEHIDCVVGMSAAVLDRVAIRFGAAFYRAVASGCSVQAAFDQAGADIEIGESGQDDVPHLLARRCNPAEVVLVKAGS